MDEILASIRKIIADDPKPGAPAPAPAAGVARPALRPGGPDAVGRIEPQLGPPGTPIGAADRRIAADIDRDLADLLDDNTASPPGAEPVSEAVLPAPEPRLPKPGWLSGKSTAPAAPAANGGSLPLTAKLEQARLDTGKPPGPVPRPNAAPLPPLGARPAAPVPGTLPVKEPEPAAKPASNVSPPSSPALNALANLAESKPVGTPRPAPEARAAPVADAKPAAGEEKAAPAGSPEKSAAAPVPAAPIPPKPATAAPVLTAEAIVAALPSSRPLGPAGDATVRSVEDLIADLLRPMLRQWLDEHMPRIVEKALRVELAKGVVLPTLPGAATGNKPADKA